MRVLVAMSGGVDSAVAAYLLHREGHEIAGATMKLFCYGKKQEQSRACCDLEAIREARRSAQLLGIPHTVVDMEESFQRDVIDDFIGEYGAARTPNPCVRCNTYVKFGPLLEKARRMGFDCVATGHYARRLPVNGTEVGWGLYRAIDRRKDQSYVLWGLERESLGRILFPLGNTTKPVVRRLARRLGLRAWDRPDSQDICFVSTGAHTRFLSEAFPDDHPMRRSGPVRSVDGTHLGEHQGLLGYTIGQRRGMGIGGGEKLFVVRLEPETATLWVGPREATLSGGLIAGAVNLLAPIEQIETDGICAKIRYRHHPIPCRVAPQPGGRLEIRFHQPEAAVTSGQSVVLYREDRVLGGATIETPLPVEARAASAPAV